jgi:hypothetical protein
MITRTGIKAMLSRLYSDTPEYKKPNKFVIGTGDEPEDLDDEELEELINRTEYSGEMSIGYPVVDLNAQSVEFRWFLNNGEANGNTLKETGIETEEEDEDTGETIEYYHFKYSNQNQTCIT